jgi:hypothetical protein
MAAASLPLTLRRVDCTAVARRLITVGEGTHVDDTDEFAERVAKIRRRVRAGMLLSVGAP